MSHRALRLFALSTGGLPPAVRTAVIIPLVALGLGAYPAAGFAQGTTGQVVVVTEPSGATVHVDGREVGLAPVTVAALVPGAHLVVAIAADGSRAEQVVEVEADRSQLVQLVLAAPQISTPPPPPTEMVVEPLEPAPAEPGVTPGTTPIEAIETAPVELVATDLSREPSVGPTVSAAHQEDEPIAATGFPGLLGNTLGVRLDVPIYIEHPVQPIGAMGFPVRGAAGPIALARLSIEAGFGPVFGLIGAIDFNNGAFGVGIAVNLPGYIPVARTFALALQPRLQGIVSYATAGGVFFSLEAQLRVGFAPIPNVVIGLDFGAVLTGVASFDRSTLVEGAYFGPVMGGGVEWAFY